MSTSAGRTAGTRPGDPPPTTERARPQVRGGVTSAREGRPGARDVDWPRVLVVGGFMTAPPNYFPLRRRLLARGATGVDIAPIGPLDWLAGGGIGFGPLLATTGQAIERTY